MPKTPRGTMIELPFNVMSDHVHFIHVLVAKYKEWGEHGIILLIITIEFFVLIGISLCSIIIGFIRDKRYKQQSSQRVKIHRLIHDYLYTDKPLPFPFLDEKMFSLENIIPLLDELDTHITSKRWQEIKANICLSPFRDQAKKWAQGTHWQKLNLGLRFLNFTPLSEDEDIFLQGIRKPQPLIKMQAAEGLVKISSISGIKDIIDLAGSDIGYTGFAYLDVLIHADLEVYQIVLNHYKNSSHSHFRLTCLKIIQNKISENILSEIERDLQSENQDLVVEAVSTMGQIPTQESLFRLQQLLHHPEETIRVEAIKSISQIGDKDSLPLLLQSQRDSKYSVRLQACLAMLRLGQEGFNALHIIDQDMDRYASETAKYVLSFNLEAR